MKYRIVYSPLPYKTKFSYYVCPLCEKLIGENFAENRGRLPWPVEQGVITSQFGMQNHPILKYVTEDNPGIEITSSGKTIVRSIFKGEVARVFTIPGANMTVIVRHGKYYIA